jgi:hypothetical protein
MDYFVVYYYQDKIREMIDMKLEIMERMNDKEIKREGIIFINNRLIALRLAYNNLTVSELKDVEYSQEYKEIRETLEKRLKNNIDRLERIKKEMV